MIEQIQRAVSKTGGGALFFSGGLDSSIIAAVLKSSGIGFKCFTAGITGSEDLRWAREASSIMGLDLETIEITDYEGILEEVVPKFGFYGVVDASISVPFFAACRKASAYSKKGITGLGADEVFAGYGSHKRIFPDFKGIEKECRTRVKNVGKDLKRDRAIASHFGMVLSAPFLDSKVVSKGLEIPAKEKIGKDREKIVLREIAKSLGVPDKIAERKKRAFQYGSSSMKVLKKTAKKHGFKTTGEFLQTFKKE